MGFPTPLARMFQGELAGYVAGVVGSERFFDRGYFRPEVVRRLLAEHAAGKRDHHRVLWQLLVLEEWHRRFIDGDAPPEPLPVLPSARRDAGTLGSIAL